MSISNEKLERLITIAKMYYEQNLTQNEIAAAMGISRPLISRYLGEAREHGIVHIEVRSPLEGNNLLLNQVRNIYDIRGGVVVPDSANIPLTNEAIAQSAIRHLLQSGAGRCAVGWGSILGAVAGVLEKQDDPGQAQLQSVCPLVGNSGVFSRSYHSNELVRVFAQKLGAEPCYWHAPAFVESELEFTQLRELDNYKSVSAAWAQTELAIVNVGNYPSTPDFATAARYGTQLADEKAVGRLLCYYFNLEGKIIRNENDRTMQIPLDLLARIPQVVAICAANVKPKALLGALHTGLFTHLIANEQLIRDTLEYKASL